jgi:cytochrome P450
MMGSIAAILSPLARLSSATLGDYYYLPLSGSCHISIPRAILHDPEVYPQPDVFNPDRFLNKAGASELSPLDPLSATFGYGRRICPGRYMAEAQLWISIASILAVFDIFPGNDADEMGRPVKTEAKFTSGMIR